MRDAMSMMEKSVVEACIAMSYLVLVRFVEGRGGRGRSFRIGCLRVAGGD